MDHDNATELPQNADAADDHDPAANAIARVDDLKVALTFIDAVKKASLDNGDLDTETVERLRNPPQELLDVSDPDLRFSLDLFIATTTASQDTYNSARSACLRRHPDDNVLTHDAIKRKVAEWSGVVPILNHMCPNTCMAYMGPFAALESCTRCGLPRFDEHGVAREFYTIPLGPQLQALWRTPERARAVRYRSERTREIL